MIIKASQLKGKIKNLANGDVKKAESLVRLYFMERFLERVSLSEYNDSFILKGGLLTSSLLGINLRTTMDIDTTVRALPLTDEDIQRIISDICKVEVADNIAFSILYTEKIMDEFDYPGVKVHLEGHLEGIRQPIKIDVSTDDVITPRAIKYEYKLLFEDRTIQLITYNTETLLAEKVQTIISRSIANTRLRDFYDVYMITTNVEYNLNVLREAFTSTCKKRGTIFTSEKINTELELILQDQKLAHSWERFRKKNSFVDELEWKIVIDKVTSIIRDMII